MKLLLTTLFIISLFILGCTTAPQEVEEVVIEGDSGDGGLRVIEVADDTPGVQEESEEALVIKEEHEEAETEEVLEDEPQNVAGDELDSEETQDAPALGSSVHDVTIVGRDGFDPLSIVIRKGDTVRFSNSLTFGNVLIFKKEDRAGTSSSPTIPAGQEWEKTFDEVGSYSYWAFAFGVFGTITVE